METVIWNPFLSNAGSSRDDAAFLDLDLTGSYLDSGYLDFFHALERSDSPVNQLTGIKLHAISSFRFDAIPQLFKFGTKPDILTKAVRPLILIFANVAFNLIGGKQVNYCRGQVKIIRRQLQFKIFTLRVESRLNMTGGIQHFQVDERIINRQGMLMTDRHFDTINNAC